MSRRDALPIDRHLPELLASLREVGSVALMAPPGAGKTTRVPPALVRGGLVGDGERVIVLEPRRVAARAAARRMAREWPCALGEAVGYQVRFDRRASAATRVLVVTDGVFTRMLQDDPFLEGVGAVVFDEFHERRLATDLTLALARQVQEMARPGLRLVVMSATLEAGPVVDYLGCALVQSEGRAYPVRVAYAGGRSDPDAPLPARAAAGVRWMLDEVAGDVLVFLPGVGEIERTGAALSELARERDLAVLALHGSLPAEAQDAALEPQARRKVVLATNVAETSVTVEGVGGVVDAGLARTLRYDAGCGLDRLELEMISQAAAEQRAGRAGRTGPGVCLRLWSEARHRVLDPRTSPEVERVDLTAAVLELLGWGEADPGRFAWFEAPDPVALEDAYERLRSLGAVDPRGGLTETGRQMAGLPLAPRLARLLIEGHRRGALEEAALAAALLSERDPFARRRDAGPRYHAACDVLERVRAVERRRRGAGAGAPWPLRPGGEGALEFIWRAREQLRGLTRALLGRAPRASDRDEALRRALLVAYPDRLARRREPEGRRGVMVGGRGVTLSRESVVAGSELFVCVELRAGRRGALAEARVDQACGVERAWLPEAWLDEQVVVRFDREREQVVARRELRVGDLVLESHPAPLPMDGRVSAALGEAAAQDPARALGLDARAEDAQWLARVRSLAAWMPELGLPALDEASLRALLPALCPGHTSFASLRQTPLATLLGGALDHRQRQALEAHAPSHLTVPSGNRVRLRYAPGEPPVLAVRIQEMFGCARTPSVAAGRVPVLLHLLAPNMRPQQITQDLEGFWARAYPEIRKELRARYAKHAWPEDPLSASPERRPARRSRR